MTTLAIIREETLDLLDDTTSEVWDSRRLDRLLNHAYKQMVGLVDSMASAWNIVKTPITVEIVSSQREYPLIPTPTNTAPAIRKVIEVIPVTSGNRGRPLNRVSYINRNQGAIGESWAAVSDLGSPVFPMGGYYIFRDVEAKPTWIMGMVSQQPKDGTVEVTYAPEVQPLGGSDDAAPLLPPQWQHLISYKAALIGKTVTKRDITGIAALYADGLKIAIEDLETINHELHVERL